MRILSYESSSHLFVALRRANIQAGSGRASEAFLTQASSIVSSVLSRLILLIGIASCLTNFAAQFRSLPILPINFSQRHLHKLISDEVEFCISSDHYL
jgi:hypothetical protein